MKLPAIPAVLLSIVSLQLGATFAKSLFPVFGPLGVTGIRVSFAAVFVALMFRPKPWTFSAVQWRALVPYGIALGAMNAFFYASISRIPIGLAVTLEFAGPLAVAILGSRRVTDFLWAGLAVAGVVLITPWSPGATPVDGLGVLFALVAGGLWGAYILLGARVTRVLKDRDALPVGLAIASLTVLPFASSPDVVERMTWPLATAGVGVALLSSALPFLLELRGLRDLPSRTFGILVSVEPAVAALAGLLFLHEALSATQAVAMAMVTAASTGSAFSKREFEESNGPGAPGSLGRPDSSRTAEPPSTSR